MSDTIRIPLSNGGEVLIDASDLPLVERFNWHRKDHRNTSYAESAKTTQHPRLKLHRVILNAPAGVDVDHIDHDGLNNRRENLRFCTLSQNQMNRPYAYGLTSKFKGVYWHRQSRKWRAYIGSPARGGSSLGLHHSEVEAALAYDAAARQRYGEFACPNFVDGHPAPFLNLSEEEIAALALELTGHLSLTREMASV